MAVTQEPCIEHVRRVVLRRQPVTCKPLSNCIFESRPKGSSASPQVLAPPIGWNALARGYLPLNAHLLSSFINLSLQGRSSVLAGRLRERSTPMRTVRLFEVLPEFLLVFISDYRAKSTTVSATPQARRLPQRKATAAWLSDRRAAARTSVRLRPAILRTYVRARYSLLTDLPCSHAADPPDFYPCAI